MNNQCSVYQTADLVGKKWTLLILLGLYKGRLKWKRFSQIKKNLDYITSKILSIRLKELEKEEMLIKRVSTKNFPIKCEYKLTKKGEEFMSIIKKIKIWALKWEYKNKNCERRDCKDCEF